MEREVGGGIGMGNTCKSMADSCQCMTKTTTIKKNAAIKFIDFTQMLPFIPLMSFLLCKSQSRTMNCF